MRLSEGHMRRVRIIGKPGDTKGHNLHVQDIDTEEAIEHVFAADVHMSATSASWVELAYYESNAAGHIMTKDGEPVEKTIRLPDPEIDVTGFLSRAKRYYLDTEDKGQNT